MPVLAMNGVSVPLEVVDRLSRVMARVYQTDPAPAEAGDILAALAEVIGPSRAVGFTIEPLSMRATIAAAAGLPAEAAHDLINRHAGVDPWLRALLRASVPGELVAVEDLRAAARAPDRRKLDSYLRDLDRLGIAGCAGGIIRLDERTPVCIALYSGAEDGFSRTGLELLKIVMRQLGYTAALRASRLAWEIERRLLAATLDLCHMPVFVVDGRGVIMQRNLAGQQMLADGDMLQAKSGRLTAANSLEATRLAAQIARVTASPGLEMTATWHSNPADHRGVVAVISGLRLDDGSDGSGRNYAVVSIAERSAVLDASLPPGMLGELFGLTDAEDRIARLIAAGRSASNAAELTGLSLATVRTHLSHIFEKTETGSQTELVRLLSSLGPFRPSDGGGGGRAPDPGRAGS